MPAQTATAPLTALYDQQLAPVSAGAIIGRGREGIVRLTDTHPGMVAKIMRQQPMPSDLDEKLRYMVENPPPIVRCSAYRLAWPISLIQRPKRAGRTVGYLMPQLDQDRYREIGAYFNPTRRRRQAERRGSSYSYLHLLTMASNLAHAITHLHAQGHVVGDLNSRNILTNDQGRIAIIDTDSFQIRNTETGNLHRCGVGTPEYTAPRLQGVSFTELDQQADDDQFALAAMVYQLLFQGQHPFAGRYRMEKGESINTLADRIRLGSFVHGPQTKVKHRASEGTAIIWQDSPFKKQFQTAFRRRGVRTTAEQWTTVIDEVAATLQRCHSNPGHHHFGHRCTWCAYRKATGVEPFPQVG